MLIVVLTPFMAKERSQTSGFLNSSAPCAGTTGLRKVPRVRSRPWNMQYFTDSTVLLLLLNSTDSTVLLFLLLLLPQVLSPIQLVAIVHSPPFLLFIASSFSRKGTLKTFLHSDCPKSHHADNLIYTTRMHTRCLCCAQHLHTERMVEGRLGRWRVIVMVQRKRSRQR